MKRILILAAVVVAVLPACVRRPHIHRPYVPFAPGPYVPTPPHPSVPVPGPVPPHPSVPIP